LVSESVTSRPQAPVNHAEEVHRGE
jgi:hypothetical protein